MSFPTIPPAPLAVTVGRGGHAVMDPHFYRVAWDNSFQEDLTPYFIDGSVTHDLSRTAGNWILDATMSYEGWKRLTPFEDWLAVVLHVIYPNGEAIGQLGHYIVLDSPEQREEMGGTVRVDARDALWALNAQAINYVLIAPTGFDQGATHSTQVEWTQTIKNVIAEAVVPGGNFTTHFRTNIPNTGIVAQVGLDGPIFDDGTRRLEIVNGLLLGTSFEALHATDTGIFAVDHRGLQYFRQPIRTWLANPPLAGPIQIGANTITPPLSDRLISPIAEVIATTPSTADLVDEVIVYGGFVNPVQASSKAGQRFVVDDQQSVFQGSQKSFTLQTITSADAAKTAADSILEQLLTENTALVLHAEPDPTFIHYHSTIDLAIWDLNGDVVANGRYGINSVKYGLFPESPTMEIAVSKLLVPIGS